MIGSGIGAGSSRGGRASSLRSRTAITAVGPIISVQPDPAATLIGAGGILLPSHPENCHRCCPIICGIISIIT